MKSFLTDPNALPAPWFQSPFFWNLVEHHRDSLTGSEYRSLMSFHMKGYTTVNLGLSDEFINQINRDIDRQLEDENLVTQDQKYHYSESPRVFEAWKKSKSVADICKHPAILNTLRTLYRREPFPFQTINFIKGSNQPLHSDAIHFHTIPYGWVAGVWVALEDMDKDNGTLCIVPGSHRFPVIDFPSLGLPVPKYGEQFEAYAQYEQYIRDFVQEQHHRTIRWEGKKGEALIWASNLLHGGSPVLDSNRTRKSQAIHYFFRGCSHYFSPLFSNPLEGQYAEKDLATKDILGAHR